MDVGKGKIISVRSKYVCDCEGEYISLGFANVRSLEPNLLEFVAVEGAVIDYQEVEILHQRVADLCPEIVAMLVRREHNYIITPRAQHVMPRVPNMIAVAFINSARLGTVVPPRLQMPPGVTSRNYSEHEDEMAILWLQDALAHAETLHSLTLKR